MLKYTWKDKRILAINRELKRRHIMAGDGSLYWEEYNRILESQATNKQQYKGGYNGKWIRGIR